MKTIKNLKELEGALHLYNYYDVRLTMNGKLMGGIPKSPDVIENWIAFHLDDTHRLDQLAAQTADAIGMVKPDALVATAAHQSAMQTTALTDEQLEEIKQYNWCGFHSDDNGLLLEGRCIKAMFKEAANILKKKLNLTALKARIAERLFVLEPSIPLGVTKPDGNLESMVHAMTPQGPINALSRTDYVTAPTLAFTCKIVDEALADKDKKYQFAPQALLEVLLDYGTELGIGANRSQGYGRFTVDSIDARVG